MGTNSSIRPLIFQFIICIPFLGQAFLCWNFALELEEEEFDESVKEDARAKKRRIQTELSKALACLGVKHSTFHSLLASGKKKEVRTLINDISNFDIFR